MSYGIKRNVKLSFDAALKKVRETLAAEGFGIITEIDVRKTLKQKLHIEHPNYYILGACNPQMAHEALHKERLIGLFMPCNVIVYEDNGKVVIAAQDPVAIAELLENDELDGIAAGIGAKLRKAVEKV
jgi:uncharacterized protein (DUF302 family)